VGVTRHPDCAQSSSALKSARQGSPQTVWNPDCSPSTKSAPPRNGPRRDTSASSQAQRWTCATASSTSRHVNSWPRPLQDTFSHLTGLVLVMVNADVLGPALKWELLARWRTVSASLRAARHSGGDTSEGIAGRPSASGTSCDLAGLEPFRVTWNQKTPALSSSKGQSVANTVLGRGSALGWGPVIAIRGGSERLYVVARR
jgi:hypothetical protein